MNRKLEIMKIIAVNISKTIKDKTLQQATERAWKLNINRAKKYPFVIGVQNNSAMSFYRINEAKIDHEYSNRIKFDLIECSTLDKEFIKKYIDKISLRHFTTKYIK